MPDPSTALTWGAIASVIAILGGLLKVGTKVWPYVQQGMQTLTDWGGTPARKGVDAIPGVMERLATLAEQSQYARAEAAAARMAAHEARDAVHTQALATAAISSQLVVIVDAVAQLQENGGSHLRDEVKRTLRVVGRIESDTAAAAGRIPPNEDTTGTDLRSAP